MSAASLGQLAELAELLAAHFDEGELRGLALELLARTDYSQMPGRTASVAQISQWIAELVSMGRLDPEHVFARLIELRPHVPALAQLRDRWNSASETQGSENETADVPKTTETAPGSEPTKEPLTDAATGSKPTEESPTSPARRPFPLHKRATIIWASLLLVVFLAVFFIAPDQLPTYKLTMVTIIVALMAGFLAMQMTGTVLLQFKGKVGPWHAVIEASSGLAVVLFLLIWWPRDALVAAPGVQPQSSPKPSPSTTEPSQTVEANTTGTSERTGPKLAKDGDAWFVTGFTPGEASMVEQGRLFAVLRPIAGTSDSRPIAVIRAIGPAVGESVEVAEQCIVPSTTPEIGMEVQPLSSQTEMKVGPCLARVVDQGTDGSRKYIVLNVGSGVGLLPGDEFAILGAAVIAEGHKPLGLDSQRDGSCQIPADQTHLKPLTARCVLTKWPDDKRVLKNGFAAWKPR